MTTRRKGQLTKKQVDRDYPYQVEVEIPEGGLGRRLNRLHSWAMGAGFDYQTRSADRYPAQAMRWCFRDPDAAAAFRERLDNDV